MKGRMSTNDDNSLGCFIPLQSRKFPNKSIVACAKNLSSICPSMDLIALGLQSHNLKSSHLNQEQNSRKTKHLTNEEKPLNVADSIVVHRIISWQKLLNLKLSELSSLSQSGQKNLFKKGDENNVSGENNGGATSLCWSPDGRLLAVGLIDGGVKIYVVEDGGCSHVVHTIAPVNDEHLQIEPQFLSSKKKKSEKKTGADTDPSSFPKSSVMFSPPLTRSKAAKRRAAENEHHESKSEIDVNSETTAPSPPLIHDENANDEHVTIISLTWSKVSPYLEQSHFDGALIEETKSFRIRSHYLDKANHFLPEVPSDLNRISLSSDGNKPKFGSDNSRSTNYNSKQNFTKPATSATQPSSETNLTILAILYNSGLLCLYLHGRYLIATIPFHRIEEHENKFQPQLAKKLMSKCFLDSAHMTFSSDLNSIMISTLYKNVKDPVPKIQIYSFPELCFRRRELQQLTPSFCFITQQLQVISQGIRDATMKWKESTRSLDSKLKSMRSLLKDYGVTHIESSSQTEVSASPKSAILSMILIGNNNNSMQINSQRSNGGADALNQFFSTQLTEQALGRMSTTCETGVASVEAILRQRVLESARALNYAASELYGLARISEAETYQWEDENEDDNYSSEENSLFSSSPNPLISSCTALDLQKKTEELFLITEYCLSQIVAIRHRLRDFFIWMIGTLTAMKANGTANDSFERKNAKRNRPSEAVLTHLVSFLSEKRIIEYEDKKYHDKEIFSETEEILSIAILDFFVKDNVMFYEKQRIEESKTNDLWQPKSSSNDVDKLANMLFSQPCIEVSRTIKRQSILFPEINLHASEKYKNLKRIGIYKRIDLLRNYVNGCFMPISSKDLSGAEIEDLQQKQWFLIVKPLEVTDKRSAIHLMYFPCMTYNEDIDDMVSLPRFYLEGFMRMPKGYTVKEITFYEDDGTETTRFEDECEKKVRQALALLVEQNRDINEINENIEESNCTISEELWIVPYDEVQLQQKRCNNDEIYDFYVSPTSSSSSGVVTDIINKWSYDAGNKDVDTNSNGDTRIEARVRKIRVLNAETAESTRDKEHSTYSTRLTVRGSRGLGGILTDYTKLDLFDLEDDEEEDESDDENDLSGDN